MAMDRPLDRPQERILGSTERMERDMRRYMITPDRNSKGEWNFESTLSVISDGESPEGAVLNAELSPVCPWTDGYLYPPDDDQSTFGHTFAVIPMREPNDLDGGISIVGCSRPYQINSFWSLWDLAGITVISLDRGRRRVLRQVD
jgi:hypothetical protein